jgi:hypothetical protein
LYFNIKSKIQENPMIVAGANMSDMSKLLQESSRSIFWVELPAGSAWSCVVTGLQLEDFANCPGVSCQAMPAMHKAQNAKHGGANLWKISMVFDMNAVSQFFFQCRWVITQKKGGAFKLAIIPLSEP